MAPIKHRIAAWQGHFRIAWKTRLSVGPYFRAKLRQSARLALAELRYLTNRPSKRT